jgi:hypothetical protein
VDAVINAQRKKQMDRDVGESVNLMVCFLHGYAQKVRQNVLKFNQTFIIHLPINVIVCLGIIVSHPNGSRET